jgi:hypothetical protein
VNVKYHKEDNKYQLWQGYYLCGGFDPDYKLTNGMAGDGTQSE